MVHATAPQAGPSVPNPTQNSAGEEGLPVPQPQERVGRKSTKKRKAREFDDENDDEESKYKVSTSPLYTLSRFLTSEMLYREPNAAAHDLGSRLLFLVSGRILPLYCLNQLLRH